MSKEMVIINASLCRCIMTFHMLPATSQKWLSLINGNAHWLEIEITTKYSSISIVMITLFESAKPKISISGVIVSTRAMHIPHDERYDPIASAASLPRPWYVDNVQHTLLDAVYVIQYDTRVYSRWNHHSHSHDRRWTIG